MRPATSESSNHARHPSPSNDHRFKIGATGGVLLILSLWVLDNIDRTIFAIALPLIGDEYGLSMSELSLILGSFGIVYVAMQLPGGLLADRIGTRRLMAYELAIWSVLAFVTSLSSSFMVLLLLRSAMAIAAGMMPAASFKGIAERLSEGSRTTGSSLVIVTNVAAAATLPLIIAPAIEHHSWQTVLVWTAVTAAVLAVVVTVFLPNPTQTIAATERLPFAQWRQATAKVVKQKRIWALAALYCATNMLGFGLLAWVPMYLVTEQGLGISETGVHVAIPFGVMGLAALTGALLFDRYFVLRPRTLAVPALITCAILLIPMMLATTTFQFTLFQALALAASGLAEIVIIGSIVRTIPPDIAGVGIGIVLTGNQLSGVVAPVVMGFLADSYGFTASFAFLAFSTLAGAIGFMFVRADRFQFHELST